MLTRVGLVVAAVRMQGVLGQAYWQGALRAIEVSALCAHERVCVCVCVRVCVCMWVCVCV